MRSSRLHYINEDPHWAEYAEWPHLERWDDKITRLLRQEKLKRVENALLIVGVAVLLWMTWLGVGR